jgi:hypothetical protein
MRKRNNEMRRSIRVRNEPGAVRHFEDAGDAGDGGEGDLGRWVRHVDLLGRRWRWRRRRGRPRRRRRLTLCPPALGGAAAPCLRTAVGQRQRQEPLERAHQVLDAALAVLREAQHGLLHRRAPRHHPLPRGGLAAAPFLEGLVRLVEGRGKAGPHLAAAILQQAPQRCRRRRSRAPLLGERAHPAPARRRSRVLGNGKREDPAPSHVLAAALPPAHFPNCRTRERDHLDRRHALRRRDRGIRRRQHRERPPRCSSRPPRRGRHPRSQDNTKQNNKKRKLSNRERRGSTVNEAIPDANWRFRIRGGDGRQSCVKLARRRLGMRNG